MLNMDTMQDAFEIVHYDNPEIPVYIRTNILSEYPDMKALCHWHEDIELIHILEGEMLYHINEKVILMKEQDCIVVNSRQLHYGCAHRRHECKFICILFQPKFLTPNVYIYDNFIKPIVENSGITCLHYHTMDQTHLQIMELIRHICTLKENGMKAYELEVVSTLFSLWNMLFCQCAPLFSQDQEPDNGHLALQKKMVSYIYEHYKNAVTLDEIAAAGNISRSQCCMIFKQYLQQSPIDFLNKYRLAVSCYLLANTDSSIARIATSCGFNHLSYYSKIFSREYGCTPTEFRRQNRDSGR